jgi:hypothetical protein
MQSYAYTCSFRTRQDEIAAAFGSSQCLFAFGERHKDKIREQAGVDGRLMTQWNCWFM